MTALASQDFLLERLDQELALLERQWEAIDAKAGIVITGSAALIALAAAASDWLLILGQVLAAVAATVALHAFRAVERPVTALRHWRENYIGETEEKTKLVYFDTQLEMWETTCEVIETKARALLLGTRLLFYSAAAIAVGSIVRVIIDHIERR